ncbi:hypothetical protein ZWY2020_056881 [Hordeum vulgare]|nr:hypothetical protein ZWY2020_056881 [Hordeum vulgare]
MRRLTAYVEAVELLSAGADTEGVFPGQLRRGTMICVFSLELLAYQLKECVSFSVKKCDGVAVQLNVFRTRNFIWKRDKPNGKNPSDCEKVEPEKPARLKAPKLKAERAVDTDDIVEVKRDRVPTFNQMTDLYHHPFCLDIHVSKGSVRACFVHRVTSRVVSVAHSISKDMKFDLSSRKGIKACVAVGALLVKRAIEDDIHNAIYTPTKGDKIEVKIEVVLRGIIENGVDVKNAVVVQQRGDSSTAAQHM